MNRFASYEDLTVLPQTSPLYAVVAASSAEDSMASLGTVIGWSRALDGQWVPLVTLDGTDHARTARTWRVERTREDGSLDYSVQRVSLHCSRRDATYALRTAADEAKAERDRLLAPATVAEPADEPQEEEDA